MEAGCQGTMRLRVTLAGERAHTARAWMGRNAIHRLAAVLAAVSAYEARRPVVEGCEYREALQAVAVGGGVAGNRRARLGHADVEPPVRSRPHPEQAEEHVRSVLDGVLDAGDTVELTDMAPPAAPGLGDPLLAALVRRSGVPVRAKLGWTDTAFFAARGVPASNFGPGDPLLAHTAGEHLHRDDLISVHSALEDLLVSGA